MTLNTRLVSELIRQRLGLPDDSQAARIINLVPQSLKEFGRRCAADQYLRQLLTTDKASAGLALSGGKINLATAYSTYYLLEEYIDIGQMYFLAAPVVTAVSTVADTVTIETFTDVFDDLDRVQFSSTGTLPAGISPTTNYYLISYNIPTPGVSLAVMQLSSTADGGSLVNIGGVGSGVISMQKMEPTSEQPIQLLKNPQLAALPQYLDDVFTFAYIAGNSLWLLPSTSVGRVNFALPFYPVNLAALPSSAESEKLFLDVLFETVTQNP